MRIAKRRRVVFGLLGVTVLVALSVAGLWQMNHRRNLRYEESSAHEEFQTVVEMDYEAPDPVEAKQTVNVLVLAYIPPCEDVEDDCVDRSVFFTPDQDAIPRSEMSERLLQSVADIEIGLENGSAYHRYPAAPYSSDSTPYLDYRIVRYYNIYEHLPAGAPVGNGAYFPDFVQILNRFHICDYVDNQGVDQIWLWGYHNADRVPVESNMSMGRESEEFWNMAGYGDVSNSGHTDDLPQCNKTYVLFNYNITAPAAMGIHNNGHQLENVMKFLDEGIYKSLIPPVYADFDFTNDDLACGNVHYTPVSVGKDDDYDYWAHADRVVQSVCPKWKYEGEIELTNVKCDDWSCDELGFYNWWMNSLPGFKNDMGTKNKPVHNVWEAVANWDGYMSEFGQRLVGTGPEPVGTHVTLYAGGSSALNPEDETKYPVVELVDTKSGQSFKQPILTRYPDRYDFYFTNKLKPSDLEIRFINDFRAGPGQDRNMFPHSLEVDDYPTVFFGKKTIEVLGGVGVNNDGDRLGCGMKSVSNTSFELFCNGYIRVLDTDDPDVLPVCGNGWTEQGEACDDGNNFDGDSCSADCTKFQPDPPSSCSNVDDCRDSDGSIPFGVDCFNGTCRSTAPACLDEQGHVNLDRRGQACVDLFGHEIGRHCSLKPDNTPDDLTDNYVWCGMDWVGVNSPIDGLDRKVKCEADIDCGPLPNTAPFEGKSISCEEHVCVIH